MARTVYTVRNWAGGTLRVYSAALAERLARDGHQVTATTTAEGGR